MHHTSNGHVTEEEPSADEGLFGATWWSVHDVQIRGVESQGCSRQTICYQIHPQQLYGNQSLRQTQSSSQEDTV